MRTVISRIIALLLFLAVCISGFSQDVKNRRGLPPSLVDSLLKSGYIFNEQQPPDSVQLTANQAVSFLQHRLKLQYWKDPADPLRVALGQLVFEASHNPFDSAFVYLEGYPFDSLDVKWDKFFIWEPLRLRVPYILHPQSYLPAEMLPAADTSQKNELPGKTEDKIIIKEPVSRMQPGTGLKDTTILIVVDTLHQVVSAYRKFPFTYYDNPHQSDSLKAAVRLLLNYVEARDSSIIYFTGAGNEHIPVWLNSTTDKMHRFWLKTDLYDSVTVWIGAQSRNTIALYLENGISFVRPSKQQLYTDAKVDIQEIDRSKLQEVRKITVKPQYWKYRSEASFALNQAHMDNWVKGGESSVSTSLDITGFADYNNKALKITSNNFARLKYGLIWTDKNGIRKNLDLLETNSKLNHKAFGKFDFSAIMLFKTQVANGYTYANDGSKTLVSKFMSPGVLTLGFGLDYKPNKSTSINFSPFSYKGTYVTDTTGTKGVNAVDQTKYGIDPHRKSKNEPGASFMITNEYKPIKTLTMTNRIQLFTNYVNNPQNIDIDWEMILTANLNWFTDVRLNTHLIFDDDTKSPLFDKNDQPVMGPDGKQKKTARVQFKELLGLSFIFRF